MELFTPGIGLIFWQVVVFVGLFLLLMKFAWRPIASSLRAREDFIADSLKKAEEARALLEKTKQDRLIILQEAREEREESVKQTQAMISRMQEEAREQARRLSEEMTASAKASITREKEIAMQAIKERVVDLSIQVAEKILRDRLSNQKEQNALLIRYLDSIHEN